MSGPIDVSILAGSVSQLADATSDAHGAPAAVVQATNTLMTLLPTAPRLRKPPVEVTDDDLAGFDAGGQYVVTGPDLTIMGQPGVAATVINGAVTWSIARVRSAGERGKLGKIGAIGDIADIGDGGWRVTASEDGSITVDVTLSEGNEVDHLDYEARSDALNEKLATVIEDAVDRDEQLAASAEDAADAGGGVAVSPPDTSSDPSSSSGGASADVGDGTNIGASLAGVAGTMAAGAVVSAARKALSGRSTDMPPPPPPPVPPPPAWRCTHVVPGVGMKAWSIPDGRVAPSATLPAGVQLELVRVQGPWAEVVAVNGWRGWVDVSKLLPAPPS
jgi:hypothetical protein